MQGCPRGSREGSLCCGHVRDGSHHQLCVSQPWACAQQRGCSLLPAPPPGRNSPGAPGARCGLAGRAKIALLISQGSGMMRFMDQDNVMQRIIFLASVIL